MPLAYQGCPRDKIDSRPDAEIRAGIIEESSQLMRFVRACGVWRCIDTNLHW